MRQFNALVLAGGFAGRLGEANIPKALVTVDGRPLLAILLANLQTANVGEVAVTTNRPEFYEEVLRACGGYRAEVFRDLGGTSTIDVARFHASRMSARFLFCYGHVLTSREALERTLGANGECVQSVRQSSRRDPIAHGSRFVEPPFLLSRERLAASRSRSWSEYWAERRPDRVFDLEGPGEPNTSHELEEYKRWWRSERHDLSF